MTTHSDQIEEIKKAEKKAKKYLEEIVENLRTEKEALQNKLTQEIESRKKELQERREQKLEIVEQEAEHIKTTKKAEAEGAKNQLISNAKSKQGAAVDYIITKFVEHIKA